MHGCVGACRTAACRWARNNAQGSSKRSNTSAGAALNCAVTQAPLCPLTSSDKCLYSCSRCVAVRPASRTSVLLQAMCCTCRCHNENNSHTALSTAASLSQHQSQTHSTAQPLASAGLQVAQLADHNQCEHRPSHMQAQVNWWATDTNDRPHSAYCKRQQQVEGYSYRAAVLWQQSGSRSSTHGAIAKPSAQDAQTCNTSTFGWKGGLQATSLADASYHMI
jgi:hypothetical protein